MEAEGDGLWVYVGSFSFSSPVLKCSVERKKWLLLLSLCLSCRWLSLLKPSPRCLARPQVTPVTTKLSPLWPSSSGAKPARTRGRWTVSASSVHFMCIYVTKSSRFTVWPSIGCGDYCVCWHIPPVCNRRWPQKTTGKKILYNLLVIRKMTWRI